MSAAYLDSIISITQLHTESINIWSHLISTVWFGSSAFLFSTNCKDTLAQKGVVIQLYLVSATVCFLCSTLYHVFADHVHASFWQILDHVGIVIFIWASSISFVSLSFHGKQGKQWSYFTLVTLGATMALIHLLRMSRLYLEGRHYRIAIHVGFGASATLPAFHFWRYCPLSNYNTTLLIGFRSLVVINSIGGGIYATRVMDKVGEEWLNVPDLSHNIMHGAVVCGAWVYRNSLLEQY
jgi:adiponectin receptor